MAIEVAESIQLLVCDTLLWAVNSGLATLPAGFHKLPLADKYAIAEQELTRLRELAATDPTVKALLSQHDRLGVAKPPLLPAPQQPGQLPHRKLRVVFFMRSLQFGGAERVFLSLAKHFIDAVPVAVVTREAAYHPAMAAEFRRVCPVHIATDERLATVAGTLRDVCSGGVGRPETEHDTLTADVVLSWCVEDLPAIRVAAGLQNIPFVDVGHGSYEWKELLPLFARCAEGADYLAAVSETCKQAYPADKQAGVKVIYNGIEFDRITPRVGREATRAAWGIAAGQKVVLFMGRFAAVKNPRAILSALDHLPAEWRAVFIGPQSALKSEIEAEACQSYSGRAVFPPAEECASYVGDALAAADVFCLPSDSEGWPLAMLEAMGAGVPVVACRWAAMRELEGLHGPLCETVPVRPSGKQIAEAVDSVSIPGYATRRLAHARSIAWENYSAAAMAARWEIWLREISRG